MITIIALIVGAVALAILAAFAAACCYGRTAHREEREGEHLANWLSYYHYPSGEFRPGRR